MKLEKRQQFSSQLQVASQVWIEGYLRLRGG